MSALLEVMTTKEAAELWGKSHVTVKHLCTGIQGRPPRLQEGTECRKSGGTWLITRQGMERIYGKVKAMKTYRITMNKETPIEITTNRADELLNAILEMSYKGEKHGMNIPLSFVDDATEIADMEGAEALGHSPAVFTDCGEVAAIDPNGSADDLYNVISELNTYDLECVVVSD